MTIGSADGDPFWPEDKWTAAETTELEHLMGWIHEPGVPAISADDVAAYLRSSGTPQEQERDG